MVIKLALAKPFRFETNKLKIIRINNQSSTVYFKEMQLVGDVSSWTGEC